MNQLAPSPSRSRGLLWKCLTLSLALHAAFFTYVYYSPMLLQSPFNSVFSMTQAQPLLLEQEKIDAEQKWKNQVLEEVFEHILVLSPHFQEPYDLVQLPQGLGLAPSAEKAPPTASFQEENSLTLAPLNAPFVCAVDAQIQSEEESDSPALFTVPATPSLQPQTLPMDPFPILTRLSSSDLPLLSQDADEEGNPFTGLFLDVTPEDSSLLHVALPSSVHAIFPSATHFAPLAPHALNVDHPKDSTLPYMPEPKASTFTKKTLSITREIPSLDYYALADMDATRAAEWNDDFDVDITFLPNPEGKGYIFSLALTSNYDLSNHGLKQNLYFILDRSSSIQKHRFAVFKRGVLKALSSMQRGDTFNIFVMDKKSVQFSPESRPVTPKNIAAAEAFLDKQEGGGLFTASDIYATLGSILPSLPQNEEAHTAILLTNGKMELSAQRQRAQLKKWIEANKGQMALYACAVGNGNDLLTLDLLTQVSGGKLLYCDTHASFPRKLAKLILDLRDPVVKDVILTATPHNSNSHIEFYPTTSHLSQLYGHQPYIIIGQIDTPCAFELTLQGRHRDQWIAIKKSISFVDGHKGDHALEKKWNAEHAHVCYSKFLKSGKAAYLKEAKEILKNSRSEVAFQ